LGKGIAFKVLRKANARHEAMATKKAQQLGTPWEKAGNPLQRKVFPHPDLGKPL